MNHMKRSVVQDTEESEHKVSVTYPQEQTVTFLACDSNQEPHLSLYVWRLYGVRVVTWVSLCKHHQALTIHHWLVFLS